MVRKKTENNDNYRRRNPKGLRTKTEKEKRKVTRNPRELTTAQYQNNNKMFFCTCAMCIITIIIFTHAVSLVPKFSVIL